MVRVAAFLAMLVAGVMTAGFAGAVEKTVDFARDVGPILERRCLRCHKPGHAKGDLSLATIDDLSEYEYIVPGKPADSYLLDVVTADDDERPTMPKEGDPLSGKEVALVRRWIAEGARWPKQVVLREKSKADRSWWSLQPLADVKPPEIPDSAKGGLTDAWSRHPIDRFVFAKLAEKELVPNPPADRRTLIRRATYDLTGLPPTPAEVEAFLADESPNAFERLINRLLASRHYGEHWGRHWLDVVRFGESNGFERNILIDNLWPFRDYVIRSFNKDKPFDRLVMEHLAGDVIGSGDPDVEVGTAFLVCGPYDNVGNQDPVQAAQIRANTIDEFIRATGESFLGLTVGCARCHDHKFDPIEQRDYYGLYATFAGVFHGSRSLAAPEAKQTHDAQLQPLTAKKQRLSRERAELLKAVFTRARKKLDDYEVRWTREPVDRYGTEERFQPVRASQVRLVVDALDTDANRNTGFRIDEFEVWTAGEKPRNVALERNGGRAAGKSRVAEDFADAYSARLTIDGRFGARWISAGNELTITLAQPETIDRVVFSSDRTKSIGRHSNTTFVGEYRLEVSPDGKTWQKVADSLDRRPASDAHRRRRIIEAEMTPDERHRLAETDAKLARVTRDIGSVKPLPSWWVGQFRQADGPFHVFLGGDPQKKGVEVVPASLSPLAGLTKDYKLAGDSAESQRRLALARWIVGRDNPLTPRVLANRLWHYHFGTGIVDTPSDFGSMGGQPTHPDLLDWLARQVHAHGWRLKPLHKLIMLSEAYRQSSRFRAPAAEIDAADRLLWRFPPRRLSAEEVRDTMLCVADKLELDTGGPGFRLYHYLQDNVATYLPLDHHGPETYRRAVYHQNARAARIDLLTEFDCPDSAFAAPRRASTTTPLQALTLLNHSFTLDMAGHLAERLRREVGQSRPRKQVQRAFALAYSRPAVPEEVDACVSFIQRQGLRAFCRVLLNTNELIYVH